MSRDSTPQLILLAGLGSDERLLTPQKREFPDMLVPPWLPPERNESLAGYAERMAERVQRPANERLVIGGVSFGGMVAYEMARHLRPDAVVMIASCRSCRELRWYLRAARPLLSLTPVLAWSVAKLLAGLVMRVRSRVPPSDRDRLVTMFREMDPAFMHWVAGAALDWKPLPLRGVEVFQIHGCRDPLIAASRTQADVVISDGAHLINVTHASQVNAFIRRCCAGDGVA